MCDKARSNAGGIKRGCLFVALAIVSCWFLYNVAYYLFEGESEREWNERGAVSCLRTCCATQNLYRRTDWDSDGVFEYAFPYSLLNTTISAGQPIRLIDGRLANASRDGPPGGTTEPKYGYIFVDLLGDAKAGPYDDGKGNFVRGHGLCAYPAQYGRNSRMTFVVGGANYSWGEVVYRKDTKGEPVTVFPDVEKDGWMRLGG